MKQAGLGPVWAPLLRRIKDAPEVEVQECR
jgi:hypothetical protein